MKLNENEIRIYYKIGKKEGIFLAFERGLRELLEDNGYKFWASGFSCDGVRDLCFEKKGEQWKKLNPAVRRSEGTKTSVPSIKSTSTG